MFRSIIVVFAIFAVVFAAPAPEPAPKAEAKADPIIYASAYTYPSATILDGSYYGNIYPSVYSASYVASPYVASPYVASPYVSAAYTSPYFLR